MKNKTNNKLLIATTIATITLSGCVSKSLVLTTNTHTQRVFVPHVNKINVRPVKVSKWKTLKKRKKENCVNCYSSFVKRPMTKVATSNVSTKVYGYNYTENPNSSYAPHEVKLEEYKNRYLTDIEIEEGYRDHKNSYKSLYSDLGRDNNSNIISKKSIQVGAFREYAGAKLYAKRYSLLTSKYSVNIKENVKYNKPIYRVHIEGFSNEREAKEFMNRYGLYGAFLVRRW